MLGVNITFPFAPVVPYNALNSYLLFNVGCINLSSALPIFTPALFSSNTFTSKLNFCVLIGNFTEIFLFVLSIVESTSSVVTLNAFPVSSL